MRTQQISSDTVPLTVSRKALIKGGTDTEFRALVHNLLAFSSLLGTVRQSFGELIGLTGIQYTILISVLHLQDERGIGSNALAKHLSLSNPFVTIETTKLVKMGLLEKKINPDDRRRVLMRVSTEAVQLLTNLAPIQREVNDTLFASLDRQRFDNLRDLSAELVKDCGEAVALAEFYKVRSAVR